jgi:tetratricopeptide (TPR) repeat protein
MCIESCGRKDGGSEIVKTAGRVALTLVLWIGLSGIWFACSALAQSADLEALNRVNDQVVELGRQGKFAEAMQLAQVLLSIQEKELGPDHPDVAKTLNNLAALYLTQKMYAQAEPLFKRALSIREKALGPDHPDVAKTLNNLAALYKNTGRGKEAESLEKRAAAIEATKR